MALDGIFGGDEEPMQETKPPPGNRADLIEWRLAQVEKDMAQFKALFMRILLTLAGSAVAAVATVINWPGT